MSNGVELVTGRAGDVHVDAGDFAEMMASVVGDGVYVSKGGDGLPVTLANSNQVVVGTGRVWMNGRWVRVTSPQELAVESGTSGMKRVDIVVLRYVQDVSTGVEDTTVEIVTGTPSEDAPQVPAYHGGSTLDLSSAYVEDGHIIVDAPIARIDVDGITPSDPTVLVETHCPMYLTSDAVIYGDIFTEEEGD